MKSLEFMISRWLLAFCLLSGQAFSGVFNATTQSYTGKKDDVSGIQGIYITGKRKDILPKGKPTMTKIHIENLEVPGGAAGLEKALTPYLGEMVTRDNVIAIKQKIMTYFMSKGSTTIGVEVPQQMTEGGVIQFLVLKKTVRQTVYKGQNWYDNQTLNRYLGISANQQISEDALQNNLSWLNQNPFQNVQMRYVPTDNPDVLDLELTTRNRFPFRFYERADDTGSANTGYGRFATGFTWGNALWIGDLFSFEYQFASEFKRLQCFTANYTAFLSWKHLLTVMATYAIIKPSAPNSTIDARATQVSPRYTIPFKPLYIPLQQSLKFGIDYKNSNSSIINFTTGTATVQPTSLPASLTNIDVTQVSGEYTIFDTVGNHSISFDAAFYASPITFLPHQNTPSYEAQRINSKPTYYYATLIAGDVITIPKIMTISLLVRGQIASNTLPATELFSIGGYNTVRGYHEAEIAGDNGFIGNIELRSIPFSTYRKLRDQLLFLVFLDYGVSNNWSVPVNPAKQVPNTQYLLGTGPGLRYTINPYLQVRCDYGFKLKQLFISNSGEEPLLLGFGQFHVGVLLSY